MNEIEKILLEHSARYPLMEAQDYVKLLYQMHMGPGHLVTNPEEALRRVKAERTTGQTGVRLEAIGNGLSRCYLDGGDGTLTDEAITDAFILTANTFMKQPDGLLEALEELTMLSAAGRIACDTEPYKSAYVASGMPPVSHSENYRRAYHPAYRVVFEDLIREKLL